MTLLLVLNLTKKAFAPNQLTYRDIYSYIKWLKTRF